MQQTVLNRMNNMNPLQTVLINQIRELQARSSKYSLGDIKADKPLW